jgi:oxygen-independent coproporphyrinogen-3 oxidase
VDRQGGAAPEAVCGSRIAVYAHLPWCLAKCPYCDFNVHVARTWPEERYTRALARELAHRAVEPPFRSSAVSSVYFGGGTPSLFAARSIAELLDAISRHLTIEGTAEVTLEANPETLDGARLADFRAAGVNRLSLGVQSFQPHLLSVLGRHHSPEDCRSAVRAARRAGFENVSLDLIHAVPGQDLQGCLVDVEAALELAPEHVSAYCLTYEDATPLTRARDAGRVQPAGDELEAAMLEQVADRLGEAGYLHYEVSSHARPGYASRHNQSYWRGVPYLGLGAGAHSFAPSSAGDVAAAAARGSAGEGPPGVRRASPTADAGSWGERWENLRDPLSYCAAVEREGAAVATSESLTRAQAATEFCWLGLRELRGLDAEAFAARFGEPLGRAFPQLESLLQDGLLEWRGTRLALTRRGLLVADSVYAAFVY